MIRETATTKEGPAPEPFGNFPSIEEYTKHGLGMLVEATKAVNAFPSGTSRLLYGAYPTFGKVVDRQSERLVNMVSAILRNQKIRGNIERRHKNEQFELLLECNDVMLERIGSNLDEMAGLKKRPETVLVETQISTNTDALKGVGSWNVNTKLPSTNAQTAARLLTAKNIARPQINFKVPVDNSANNPFEPRIKDKPNLLKPLAVLPEYDADGNVENYLHPYEFELMKFQPPSDQLKSTKPQYPKSIESTELVYVDDQESLKKMLNEFQNVKELAVDLEHHSYRTFQGITCLMQISTRKKDYVIDALKLRDELYVLNEVFTNPKVVKIFHGADYDIEWLQRDLSLYVVNMFDTHQAAKILGYVRLSLAFLLKHFCEIEADKTLRIADWRIRPLPEELVAYARQDTHFLIYIYEMLRNELLEKQNGNSHLLEMVYNLSTDICKKRYHKPKIFPDSHMDIYRKSKAIFDNRQLIALKEIFSWRDKMARQEDESYGYVLPNHMMLQISETLPREMQGILACCNPIPPLVRQNLHILHQIILQARRQPLVKPIIEERIVNRVVPANNKDFNSKLLCPHDLSHNQEFRNDLPVLLGNGNKFETHFEFEFAEPKLDIFEANYQENRKVIKKISTLRKMKFVSPYERYKAVVPYVEKEKLDEIMKEDASNQPIIEPERKGKKDNPTDANGVENDVNKRRGEHVLDGEPRKKKYKRNDSNDKRQRNKFKQKKRMNHENRQNKISTADTTNAGDDNDEQKKEIEENIAINQVLDENNEPEEATIGSNKIEEETVLKKEAGEEIEENNEVSENTNETNDKTTHEVVSGNLGKVTPQTSDRNHLSKKKRNRKRKPKPRDKTGQKSSEPIEFDYSKVDFKRFQGGSKQINRPENTPKFHGKTANKADKKKFNKLFTFSNVNKGKRK